MQFWWMLSRGSLLAGVPCQVRDRQALKQFVELVQSCSHSVPAIHQNFMEDSSELITKSYCRYLPKLPI